MKWTDILKNDTSWASATSLAELKGDTVTMQVAADPPAGVGNATFKVSEIPTLFAAYNEYANSPESGFRTNSYSSFRNLITSSGGASSFNKFLQNRK